MKYLHTHHKIIFTLVLIFLVFGCSNVLAKVGVGMGAGEVKLTKPVKPGGIYDLPSIRIFNTGDEITTYSMNIAYHQDRHELRPSKEWFIFNPAKFTLGAGESQEVKVSMILPLKSEPGDYFAFIESGPVATGAAGTSVGVAVAAKLFFTVIPANIWQAVGYRVSAFFTTYSPWSWIVLGLILFVILISIFKKYFSFNIAVRKK